MSYDSFPKTKNKVLKSVKFKQQDVSSELLFTAFFYLKNKCKSGKNAKYIDRALGGELETRLYKGLLLKT